MDLALHFTSRTTINGGGRIQLQEKASSFPSMGRAKKGSVCCKKPSNRRTSNPSKSNQEEIIALLKRIQSSISNGESRGVKEKNSDDSSESKPLTKAILDVLEKSRKIPEGGTSMKEDPPKKQEEVPQPPSSSVKRTTSYASGPRGKLPVSSISDKALGEMTNKEEKASLIETMKLAELKEVAKNRGIKGYSKLRKSELIELIISSWL